MNQNLKVCRSGRQNDADTNSHRFPDTPSRLVVLSAPSGNTSDVTILGVDPANSSAIDSNGITLVKGGSPLTLWLDNLNQLAYKLGTASDQVQWLVLR